MNELSYDMTEEHRAIVKKRLVNATLNWCNDRRKERGLEPLSDLPKGQRWEGTSCPCGVACGLYVGYRNYFTARLPYRNGPLSVAVEGTYPYSEENSLGSLPGEVGSFARAFDRGFFPEYEEGK